MPKIQEKASFIRQYECESFLFSQDLHGVDLEEFKYGGTNITAFRLVDPDGPEIRRAVRDWTFPPDTKMKKTEPIPILYRVSSITL